MMTILLYGFLGKQFGKIHKYAVHSPAEAIKAMSATIKGFKKAVVDGGSYRVLSGSGQSLSIDDLSVPTSLKNTLKIIPVVNGASGGWLNVIVGIVLVVVGTYVPGFQALVPYGWAMIAGGVAQVLFAPDVTGVTPADNNPVENRPSYSFNGTVNTISQGNPVPVCYGRLIVGSQIISGGLSAEPA
jgi:predicted phage tail protein